VSVKIAPGTSAFYPKKSRNAGRRLASLRKKRVRLRSANLCPVPRGHFDRMISEDRTEAAHLRVGSFLLASDPAV
jgi:hypothetical protein